MRFLGSFVPPLLNGTICSIVALSGCLLGRFLDIILLQYEQTSFCFFHHLFILIELGLFMARKIMRD